MFCRWIATRNLVRSAQIRTFNSIASPYRFARIKHTPQSSHAFISHTRTLAKVNDSLDDAERSIQGKAFIVDLDEAKAQMSTIFVGGWTPKWLTVPDRFSSESSFSSAQLVLSRLREAAKAFQGMLDQGAFVDLTVPDQNDGMVHIIVPEDVYTKYWSLQDEEQPSTGVDTKGGHKIPTSLLKEIQRVHDDEPSPDSFRQRLKTYEPTQDGALIGWQFRADSETLFCNLKLPDLIEELKQVANWLEECHAQGNTEVYFEDGQIVVNTHDAKIAERMSIPPLYSK